VHSVKGLVHEKMGTEPGGEQEQITLRLLVSNAKRAIAELAETEGRLLSIHDELFGRAWQLGKLLAAISARRDFARIDNAAC